MSCECKCHHYGPGSHVTCDVDRRSSGSSTPSCSPCDGATNVTRKITPLRAADGRVQAPCVYPGCDDGTEGDERTPRLTRNVICNSCRRRYGKVLGWLVMDYVVIKSAMPSPTKRPGDGSKYSSPKAKSFGHPAEWPSDRAAMIADHLNELEHDLREHLADGAAVHPRVLEAARVRLAYEYLTRHFDALCIHPAAGDYAENLADLHGKNRTLLGQTRMVEKLPTPCPTCGVAALVRSIGQIDCGGCHRVIEESQYPFLVRMVLNDLITAYDDRLAIEA